MKIEAKNRMRIMYGLLLSLLFISCDSTIHEYPQESKSLVVIQANVNRMPPLYYKGVQYDASFHRTVTALSPVLAEPYNLPDGYQMRITIEIYRGNIDDYANSRDELAENMIERRVLYEDKDAQAPQDTIHAYLKNGNYFALAFADYVKANDHDACYYNTRHLTGVLGDIHNYPEETNLRSTAMGQTEFNINFLMNADGMPMIKSGSKATVPSRVVPVYMSRPSARYRLVAADYDEFVRSGGDIRKITAKIIYKQYVAVGYDVVKCTPNVFVSTYSINIKPFISGTGEPSPIMVGTDYEGVSLIVDYVFAHFSSEDNIVADIYFYDEGGKEINHVLNLDIPLARDKETIIKGYFLTKAYGKDKGITIDENFEGEYLLYF